MVFPFQCPFSINVDPTVKTKKDPLKYLEDTFSFRFIEKFLCYSEYYSIHVNEKERLKSFNLHFKKDSMTSARDRLSLEVQLDFICGCFVDIRKWF